MQLTANYLGGEQFEVVVRGHRIICDQPVENSGTDKGMSPPEFLLAALATCAGYYAEQYLNARGLATENLSIHVTAEKASHPSRITAFHIEVEVGDMPERHRDGVLRAVKTCLVHNTLLSAPTIEVAVRTPAFAE